MKSASPSPLRLVAERHPERQAVIIEPTGETLSYGELLRRSSNLGAYLQGQGVRRGDGVAIVMENRTDYASAIWACLSHGYYAIPVAYHLKPDEIAYMLADSGAVALITSSEVISAVANVDLSGLRARVIVDGEQDSFQSLTGLPDAQGVESGGNFMFYSSGTTGKPKGIRHPLLDTYDEHGGHLGTFQLIYRLEEGGRYFSGAPLYHGMPLGNMVAALLTGGTVIVQRKFDPEAALAVIEKHRVTASGWVPTMFVRMLRLPDEVRNRYDLSSLRSAVHSAAPCSPDVKRRMIEWWGPIINEFYSGSEGIGLCATTSEEWLAHPGTVGRPVYGKVHVLDENFGICAPGETGMIYFEGGHEINYHNDAEKTRSVFSPQGWATLGDIGHVDKDGYLFLTDRKAFMIISGGVNIYPQEIEDVLIQHPAVLDVAVFGVPNAEFGEEVKAVVVPTPGFDTGEAGASEIMDFCRARLSHVKCPRSLVFLDELPRGENGKLYKKILKARYSVSDAA